MRKTVLATAILAASIATPVAYAHQAGDFIVRAGAIHLSTHENSGTVGLTGNLAGTSLHNHKFAGFKAKLNNDTQLGLNFAYMITDKWAVELLAASPFELTAKDKGMPFWKDKSAKIGSFKALPPTLSAVYYPMNKASAFQPYVGLGVNRTLFFDEKGDKSNGYSALRVQNTWGWAAQIGADYMLTDKLMINGQVRYIDIKTKATVNYDTVPGSGHPDLQSKAKVKINVKPVVYMVGLGYKF